MKKLYEEASASANPSQHSSSLDDLLRDAASIEEESNMVPSADSKSEEVQCIRASEAPVCAREELVSSQDPCAH
jgi:hypothetical protein